VVLFLQLAGGEFTHIVTTGESISRIGARYGVDSGVIARENGLGDPSRIEPGQLLRINNTHIVPASQGLDIVINIPQRMLFHFRDGAVNRSFPIAAGRPGWETPLGDFKIVVAESDPVWDVPRSIQEEMRSQGRPVVTKVPAGPNNPLGKYWLGLSLTGIGIHGTNAPSSIYGWPSHGCIRMHPDDIKELFFLVGVGTSGKVIYEPVLILRVENTVYVEAHPDTYKRGAASLEIIHNTAGTEGYADMVDWSLVQEVIRMREGVARRVNLR
jgi:L,D-transpeptidase ErfK/SrfK